MDIRVTAQKVKVTAGIREHLKSKLLRFEKYTSRLVESHAILKKQRYFFEAEITLLAKRLKVAGEGQSSDNIFSAIDQAAEHVEKQLKRYREKLKDHHKAMGKKGLPFVEEEQEDGKEESPVSRKKSKKSKLPNVISSGSSSVRPMSIRDASLQLQSTTEPFFIFYNIKSEKVNVIYKRNDGHHGLVEV